MNPSGAAIGSRQQRPRTPWLLALAVLAAHLWLAEGLVQQQVGWGRGDGPPPAIEVAFVRELAAAAPAVAAPAPPPAARLPAVARRPQPAASAAQAEPVAEPAASAPAQVAASAPAEPTVLAAAPEPPVVTATLPREAPPEPAPAAASTDTAVASMAPPALPAPAASAAAAFDWPPSTRLNYLLNGHYRGPVHGSAQVEWLREGGRYQVRMRTAIGPVLSRQIVSEGELTASGLAPRRFDGEQKVLFSTARRWSLRFSPERITLNDGREIDSLPGAQDEASQFVQLTWLFTTQPDRLQVGRSIEVPLIVNRTLERWTYDVVAEAVLNFPFGPVPTFHVKPRRAARGGDLLAEIWFAPTLQYLPVRILIRQRDESWADLTLERPPLQAAPAGR